jgi:glycosyltransferase 2 family protein
MRFLAFIRKPIVIANAVFIVALVVFFTKFAEFSSFLELLATMKVKYVLIAIALQAVTYVCNGAMWTSTLSRFGHKISVGMVSTLSVMKLFVDQMIPSFGMSGDLMIVKRLLADGVERGEAATVLIINLFTRYASYIILFVGAVILLWTGGYLNRSIQVLAVVFLIFVTGACVGIYFLIRRAHKGEIPPRIARIKFLKPFITALTEAEGSMFRYPALWIKVGFLQASIFVLDILTLQALVSSLGFSLSFEHAYMSFMLASAVATLSIIPAGVGAFEGTAVATLMLFKIPFDIAVAGTLLLRGFAYWIPMIPGAVLFWKEMKSDTLLI